MAGLFWRGKYKKELKELQEKVYQNPKNLNIQIRVGDLLERMGKREEALEVYRKVSERFTQAGFFMNAIAINKVILRLDPSQAHIHNQLAELYAKRGMIVDERMDHVDLK